MNDTLNEDVNKESEQLTPDRKITLKDGMGAMTHRIQPAIIRYHQWSAKKEPEKYYHAQLMLYYPWCNEEDDLLGESYKDSYNTKLDVIQKNRQTFEHFAEEVSGVLEDIEQYGIEEDAWDIIAAQTQQENLENCKEGAQIEDSVLTTLDSSRYQGRAVENELGITPSVQYEISNEALSTNEWLDIVLSLNAKQYELHQFIVEWAMKMTLSHRVRRPDPFHVFLTGGAGTGKSHLVRTIVQTVNKICRINKQAEDVHVLVCAPTGAAAYNIAGQTCHSAFLLPLHKKRDDDYLSLSMEKLSTMKETLGNVKLIVIDEISMVGADTLLTIHRRLCEMKGTQDPFGGISILSVGDLLQLPPVAQRPVFAAPTDEMSAIFGSLWKSQFKMVELTEIQRQKDDETFANLLNRVRIGQQTEDDVKLLKAREICKSSPEYPQNVTHIFAENKEVNKHNKKMLESLETQTYTFKAVDSKRDEQTQRIENNSKNFRDMSGGLVTELKLAVGAKVVLTKNVDVSDGLVNSAAGVVTGFLPEPDENAENYKPKYILVKFFDDRVGRKKRKAAASILKNTDSTPVSAIEVPVNLGNSLKITAKRTQFPLTQAWAVTIHKEQGKTEDALVLSCNGSFHAGQFYTAISRTKTLEGLNIIDTFTPTKIKVNTRSLREMERMRKHPFLPNIPTTISLPESCFLKFSVLNINSFIPHIQCIQKDSVIEHSHICCLIETWLFQKDQHPEFHFYNSLRKDSISGDSSVKKRRCGGMLMYIQHTLYIVSVREVKGVELEYQYVVVCPAADRSRRVTILSIYRNPRLPIMKTLCDIERLLSELPDGCPAVVAGDFNIDLGTNTSNAQKLTSLMLYYGFCQLVKTPTHRRGGLIDHVYTNLPSENIVIDIIATYYSDHHRLCIAVPFKELQ